MFWEVYFITLNSKRLEGGGSPWLVFTFNYETQIFYLKINCISYVELVKSCPIQFQNTTSKLN